MLASYLLDATRSAHPLEELALEHAGYKALREEDLCGRGAKAIPFAQVADRAARSTYAGERADLRAAAGRRRCASCCDARSCEASVRAISSCR